MDFYGIALWLYVILTSLLMGGSLFERFVLVSVWSSAPPASVREWNANPKLALVPGRFFRFVSLPLLLVIPLELYLAWSTPSPERGHLLLSAAVMLVVMIATLVYYFPTLDRLTMHQGKGMDDAQVVKTTRVWVALQWLRLAMVAFGWVEALIAFQIAR